MPVKSELLAVNCRAVADVDGPERAADLLGLVEDADVPDRFSNRLSTLPGTDPADVDGAYVVVADHVPDAIDVQEAEPCMLEASCDGDLVAVEFTADDDGLSADAALLDRLLDETALDVEQFGVQYLVDGVVHAEDVDAPREFVQLVRGDPERGQSLVALSICEPIRLEGGADPLLETFEAARNPL
jgi:hypothetical protein